MSGLTLTSRASRAGENSPKASIRSLWVIIMVVLWNSVNYIRITPNYKISDLDLGYVLVSFLKIMYFV